MSSSVLLPSCDVLSVLVTLLTHSLTQSLTHLPSLVLTLTHSLTHSLLLARVFLANQRGEKFWVFVVNIMVPGPPFLSFVMYLQGDKVMMMTIVDV